MIVKKVVHTRFSADVLRLFSHIPRAGRAHRKYNKNLSADEWLPNMVLCMVVWAPQVVLVVKNLPANAGDTGDAGSIPESGRSLGEGNGNPL